MAEGNNPQHGVNGILSHNHMIFDPYLGLERFEIRIILCACIENRYAMDLSWDPFLEQRDQHRYSSVTKYKYYPI